MTAILLMLPAYNDWHIDEWAAAYPGRFIPIDGLGPMWDSDAWSPRFAASRPRAAGR